MERPHRSGRRRWAALALALVGCSDTCGSTTEPGAVGELGNGRFLYTCGGASDPACESAANEASADYFPACIALGGTFDLEYELIDTSALEPGVLTPVIYVESVNQGFFRGTDTFEALRPGTAAFVVREGERVLDLIHLAIVEPDGLDVIVRRDPAAPSHAIELPAGDTEVMLVLPRSSECLELGGAVPIEAESSDEAVAGVSADDVLRIQAIAPGTAMVTARVGELERKIAVTVVDGFGPSTTGESEGDTGLDTGGSASTEGTGTTGVGTGTGTTGETSGASTGGSSTSGGT